MKQACFISSFIVKLLFNVISQKAQNRDDLRLFATLLSNASELSSVSSTLVVP